MKSKDPSVAALLLIARAQRAEAEIKRLRLALVQERDYWKDMAPRHGEHIMILRSAQIRFLDDVLNGAEPES